MDISGLFIRIIFLLVPGAVASTLYRKLRGKAVRKDWEDISQIIIFSLASYTLYAVVLYFINWARTYCGSSEIMFTAFDAFFDDKISISWKELLFASLAGVVIALFSTKAYTARWINKVGSHLNVTNHVGEEDIWYFFQNLPINQWVFVRDHKTNLVYKCWIDHFSDPYKERELILREVEVFHNDTGERLYEMDTIYLSRKSDELTIEIPPQENTAEEGQEENTNESED